MTAMDPLTLEELMKEYGQDVWSFAYSITKNRAMADDIAQDAFLQAYRNLVSFRGESSVRTWLLRIARNISLNYRNSAFFRRVLLIDAWTSSGSDRSAEQAFFEQEAANDIWKHVFSLPVKQREVLVLHAKYQLSLLEIARILDVPEGTVKSRLFGARKRMSNLLKEEFTYEPV